MTKIMELIADYVQEVKDFGYCDNSAAYAALQAEVTNIEQELLDYKNMVVGAEVLIGELRAKLAGRGKQEPVAYGHMLGSHYQSVYAIPATGAPPWMVVMTPLYLSAKETTP